MFELSNLSFKGKVSKNLVKNLENVKNKELKVRSVDLSSFTRFTDLTPKQKIAATESLLDELEHAANMNKIFQSIKN